LTRVATIRDLVAAAASSGEIDARHEAELLLGHVLGRPRAWLYAHAQDGVDVDAQRRFESLVEARRGGRPVAYLTGTRGFWTLDLLVTPDVLIPRAETERLVELALERIPVDKDCAVADLGTGSGAIALAIASERPRARIVATDASPAALAVARANAERLGLANVSFAGGDWCAALGAQRFDVIVSNPPYIAAADPHLGQGDLRFEPVSALASGNDGLDAIRSIAAQARAHLEAGGWLLVEHGFEQGEVVRALFSTNAYTEIATARDLEQRERVTLARTPLRPLRMS